MKKGRIVTELRNNFFHCSTFKSNIFIAKKQKVVYFSEDDGIRNSFSINLRLNNFRDRGKTFSNSASSLSILIFIL